MEAIETRTHWKWSPVLALPLAFILAVVLFLLVPMTQLFQSDSKRITYREMQVLAPPPPKAPPSRQRKQTKQAEKKPELQKDFQDLTLQQLELSLNPGLGDAFAMGAGSIALETELDVMEEVRKIFNFNDLNSAPRMIAAPRFDYPHSLIRQGIKRGKVDLLIEIDETGRPEVREILSSSHQDLVAVARSIVERSRFSISKVDGKAVRVRGNFPLLLEAP